MLVRFPFNFSHLKQVPHSIFQSPSIFPERQPPGDIPRPERKPNLCAYCTECRFSVTEVFLFAESALSPRITDVHSLLCRDTVNMKRFVFFKSWI